MQKMLVMVQDSALPINSKKVTSFLDESLKPDIQFSRVPINSGGEFLTQILQVFFTDYREKNPEGHIFLMTSSMIYGSDFIGDYEPEDMALWLKKNFANSSYAVRSMYKYTPKGNIDFYFEKQKDVDKGIAENVMEVYRKVYGS
jgi:hypothetical protein